MKVHFYKCFFTLTISSKYSSNHLSQKMRLVIKNSTTYILFSSSSDSESVLNHLNHQIWTLFSVANNKRLIRPNRFLALLLDNTSYQHSSYFLSTLRTFKSNKATEIIWNLSGVYLNIIIIHTERNVENIFSLIKRTLKYKFL